MPATANRFFIGFFGAEDDVRTITGNAVEAMGDKLTAVNVFNEAKLLKCKFAWMAVRNPEDFEAVEQKFGESHTVITHVDGELDEVDATFKHRAYLNLILKRDGGKLTLSEEAIDFLIKDLTGGIVIERELAKRVAGGMPPLEALLAVVSSLTPGVELKTVTVDPELVVQALKFCEVRRSVARAKKEQTTSS